MHREPFCSMRCRTFVKNAFFQPSRWTAQARVCMKSLGPCLQGPLGLLMVPCGPSPLLFHVYLAGKLTMVLLIGWVTCDRDRAACHQCVLHRFVIPCSLMERLTKGFSIWNRWNGISGVVFEVSQEHIAF